MRGQNFDNPILQSVAKKVSPSICLDGRTCRISSPASPSQHNATVAQVLVRWSLQKGYSKLSAPFFGLSSGAEARTPSTVPLPKSDTPGRISENFDVFGIELSGEDMKEIDSLDQGKSVSWNPVSVE
jgi:aryl-alcohol dehydrogenase-like predicted oxidoreductase